MTSGLKVAALFLGYGAIGLGGDLAVGLFADAPDPDYDFQFTYDIDPEVSVDVQVEPDVRVDVQVRGYGDCAYSVTRELSLEASASNTLRLRHGSGQLDVEGREGLDRVEVEATVCASHEEYIDQLTVSLERSGDEVALESHYPENRRSWRGNNTARIDMKVYVPLGMEADIDDSSGSMSVSGVGPLRIDDSSGSISVRDATGPVWIEDSSGSISLHGAAGDVEIRDGSGSITVENVEGSVRLDDGSGSIRVSEVTMNVIVEDDGSGSIAVQEVGGDFVVQDDGSGGIRHSGVRGNVDIPADQRRRRRGN